MKSTLYKIKNWLWKVKCSIRHYYGGFLSKINNPNAVVPYKLGTTYSDRDRILYHAIFQVLCDFVEKEMMSEWGQSLEHNPEILELYHWWKEFDEEYPWNLDWNILDQMDEEELNTLSEDRKKLLRDNCKRVIDLSPTFWT